MRQITTTAFLGMLALTITGCPSSDNPQTTNPSPSVSPTPVVVVTPATKPPLVASNPTSAAYLAPGLIQPTNANQRTKQVAKGNQDPFAALFLPIPTLPASVGNSSPASVGNSSPYNNSPSSAQTSQAGSSSSTSRQTSSRNANTPSSARTSQARSSSTSGRQISSRNANTGQSSPNSVAIINPRTTINQRSSTDKTATSTPNLPDTNLPPAIPPAPPDTTLANGVMVMGVIQIGEQTQAIVQVPSEATSRYVQVGQRLSNGQVLVKRIELTPGLEPIVILEQYGVEVSKAVGEQSPNQEQQTTPTAILPLPSPSPSTATAAVPFLPPQNTRTNTAELPAPPQDINPVGTNISVPELQPANPIAPALVR